MNTKKTLVTAVTALAFSMGTAFAAVSPEEAAKLGGDVLTPVGAERAGNADGTIPAWTGGMTVAPAGYVAGETRIDPFADEKPLFTIDASNYEQYADKLSEGQKALFKKYPDTFKMPIYKTHRTAAAPQYVYDFTKKNATRGELTGGGAGVQNVYGGYPFPIPQNGYEALWNHTLRWIGQGVEKKYANMLAYSNGTNQEGGGTLWESYPYFREGGSLDNFNGNILELLVQYKLPVRRKGEVILVRDPVNAAEASRQAWQYIPGQRRVRRAPTIAHDTPHAQFGGQLVYDETFMWNGSPERFDVKLIGKKEMYVPYNNNGFVAAAENGGWDTIRDITTPGHPNPAYERWELHRVWVVEMTLKEGKRHVYGKRVQYLDEDSWAIVANDHYDGRGELWRTSFAHLLNAYDVPLTTIRATWHTDLQNGNYGFNEIDLEPIKVYEGEPSKYYTPANVRKLSRR